MARTIGLRAVQPAVKQQHVGINRTLLWWPGSSAKVEEGVGYVFKISGSSVNVPGILNPKAFPPSFDSMYAFLWCGIKEVH